MKCHVVLECESSLLADALQDPASGEQEHELSTVQADGPLAPLPGVSGFPAPTLMIVFFGADESDLLRSCNVVFSLLQ